MQKKRKPEIKCPNCKETNTLTIIKVEPHCLNSLELLLYFEIQCSSCEKAFSLEGKLQNLKMSEGLFTHDPDLEHKLRDMIFDLESEFKAQNPKMSEELSTHDVTISKAVGEDQMSDLTCPICHNTLLVGSLEIECPNCHGLRYIEEFLRDI